MLCNTRDMAFSLHPQENFELLPIWVAQISGSLITLPYPRGPLPNPPIDEILKWCNDLPTKVIARFKFENNRYMLFEQNIWFTSMEDLVMARMVFEEIKFQVKTQIYVWWPNV